MKRPTRRAPRRSWLGLTLACVLLLGGGALGSAQADSLNAGGQGGGGGKNVVMVMNQSDERLRVGGAVQLNRIPGPAVEPVNLAQAYSSCTDCQSLAVALQFNLISRTATRITPQNAAVAVNSDCSRCYTVARAFQYVYQVDDPARVPPEVSALLREMDRELKAIQTDPGISLPEAEARIDAVVASFQQFAESMAEQRDEATEPTSPEATPMPTSTPPSMPSPTAELAPTPSPTAEATSTTTPGAAEPTPALIASQTMDPTATPSPALSPTP